MNNNDNDKNIGREIHEAWSECFVKHNSHVSVVKDHLNKDCRHYQNKIKAKQNLVTPAFFTKQTIVHTQKQIAITEKFMPCPSKEEQSQSDLLLAEYLFVTGTAFARVDHPLLKSYVQSLRPDSHAVAYLLDPYFVGERFDADLEGEVMDFIVEWREEDGKIEDVEENQLYEEKVLAELHKFLLKQRELKNEKSQKWSTWKYNINTGPSHHPRNFWKLYGARFYPELNKIAQRVFNLAASSASAERSFNDASEPRVYEAAIERWQRIPKPLAQISLWKGIRKDINQNLMFKPQKSYSFRKSAVK
eukprot:gene16947-23268_t